ncbi:MAG TPA: ABC transporter permease, partial [Verrucomicrobiae bacterium]|jgi:lipopolysaccharide transport system permease protein|nr:ABC transporter permease [Verrucomicrobiae bacterium]
MEITSNPESFCRHLNPLRLGRELWNSRAVLVQFAGKEVLQRYRGSQLGLVWIFLQPIFLLAVYTIAFGLILKTRWPESQRTGLGEVAMAVYCGLTAFGIFSECSARAPMLLLENASYVKRALFPIQMLPVCVVLSASFHCIVNLAILTALGWILSGFYAPALLAPIVLLPLVLLSCGATLLLAAVGPIFRDLRQFITPMLLAVSFLTPMFYSPKIVPARLDLLVNANPLAFTITTIRQLVMWHGSCDWLAWGIWTVVCAAFMILAHAIFMRLRHEVTDLV